MCFMLPSIRQEDYLTGFSTVNLYHGKWNGEPWERGCSNVSGR